MKYRNLKKTLLKRKQSGFRSYITFRIPLEKLGIKEYLNKDLIANLLNLEKGKEDGFQDRYELIDRSIKNDAGVPLTVNMNFDYRREIFDRDSDTFFLDKYGYKHCVNFVTGYVNPNYGFDSDEYQVYWLDNSRKESPFKKVYAEENQKMVYLLEVFADSNKIRRDLQGDCTWDWDPTTKEITYRNDRNELFSDISKLGDYCKVTYIDKIDNKYLEITGGVRYAHGVEDYITDLSRIIKKHKLTKF